MENNGIKITIIVITVILLSVFIVYLCCIKQPEVQDYELNNSPRRALDPLLWQGVEELINTTTDFETGNIDKLQIPIAIEFMIDAENVNVIKSDSCVFLSYFHKGFSFSPRSYKGSIEINNHSILIFDEYDIGSVFYDENLLEMTPIDSFFRPEIKLAIVSVYRIGNKCLSRWENT